MWFMTTPHKSRKAVLWLRPEKLPAALSRTFETRGVRCFVHSFMRIVPLPVNKTDVARVTHQQWDGVVIVSKNAAYYAAQAGFIDVPSRYYTVGPGSAAYTAKQLNVAVNCPTFVHQSEGVLGFSELQQLEQQKWLIIRGEGGREVLANALRSRGASVDYWELYRREQCTLNDPEQLDKWINTVTTIVVTSAEQLSYFLSSMPRSAEPWLRDCHWLVPSHRLKGLIPFGQSDTITVTDSATDTILMDALLSDGNTHD